MDNTSKEWELVVGELVIHFIHRETSARNYFQALPTEQYYKKNKLPYTRVVDGEIKGLIGGP